MHFFFSEVCLWSCAFAFMRPIRDAFLLTHNHVASVPTGAHLENQELLFLHSVSFACKIGRRAVPNTLIHFAKDVTSGLA